MLKAGFARLDITPPFGTPLAGYYEMRYADGVLDPVCLNAVAVNSAEDTILIITADVLMVRLAVADELRELIAKRTGVPTDHILINSLHQHTSLRIGGKGGAVVKDQAYLDIFYRKFADVAQMAIDDMAEASYGTAVEEAVTPISFVRRYYLKDGSLQTNPGHVPVEELVGPAARSDNKVRLLRFQRSGKPDIAIVNFCTHPDVIGGTKISADWPGFVRRFVEAEHPDAHCMLMNGFQGDTNQHNYMIGPEGIKRGYTHSEYMGRVIADTVNLIWDRITTQEKETLYGATRIVFNKCSTRGEEHYEECKEFADRYRAGDYSKKETASGIVLAEACRIADIPGQPVYHKLLITVLGLGDIVFFGLSGEPFTEYSYNAQELVPDKFLMTATCANGGEGYLPSKLAFEQGGYEVISSHFTPELEETIIKAAGEMLIWQWNMPRDFGESKDVDGHG